MEEYKKTTNFKQYQLILDAADLFIKTYPDGASTESELNLGIDLFKELVGLKYVTSLREYEDDMDLYGEILRKKLLVFRLCIPSSHSRLRGLTEMIAGMKENELG